MNKTTLGLIVSIMERRQVDAAVMEQQIQIVHSRLDIIQGALTAVLDDDTEPEQRRAIAKVLRKNHSKVILGMFKKSAHATDQIDAAIADLKSTIEGMGDDEPG